jgi:hypothetical protein
MKRRQSAVAVAPPPAVNIPKQLTPSELKQAARNIAQMQAARLAWNIGDQRDGENPCECGAERLEVLTDISPKGCQTWTLRCPSCKPFTGES